MKELRTFRPLFLARLPLVLDQMFSEDLGLPRSKVEARVFFHLSIRHYKVKHFLCLAAHRPREVHNFLPPQAPLNLSLVTPHFHPRLPFSEIPIRLQFRKDLYLEVHCRLLRQLVKMQVLLVLRVHRYLSLLHIHRRQPHPQMTNATLRLINSERATVSNFAVINFRMFHAFRHPKNSAYSLKLFSFFVNIKLFINYIDTHPKNECRWVYVTILNKTPCIINDLF
jgi:hypothetical protein